MIASHDPTPAPAPSLAQFTELIRRHQAVVGHAAALGLDAARLRADRSGDR